MAEQIEALQTLNKFVDRANEATRKLAQVTPDSDEGVEALMDYVAPSVGVMTAILDEDVGPQIVMMCDEQPQDQWWGTFKQEFMASLRKSGRPVVPGLLDRFDGVMSDPELCRVFLDAVDSWTFDGQDD